MEINGIINFLKPGGMTSHDAVGAIRRISGIKKVGHTGTLDPMATGVLPICIGKGTRIIEYLDKAPKSYRCEMQLGLVTDTQDIWGTVLETHPLEASAVKEEQIRNVLENFKGEISQIPPKYSAIKVDGRRLYEYARNNRDVEIKSRKIYIYDINLIRFDEKSMRALFDVYCSKGTYVRTICQDAGAMLGCGAAMSFLSRTGASGFRLENAVSAEELEAEGIGAFIHPMDEPLDFMGSAEIYGAYKERFGNGQKLKLNISRIKMPEGTNPSSKEKLKVYCEGAFLGIASYDFETDLLIAEKVLFK